MYFLDDFWCLEDSVFIIDRSMIVFYPKYFSMPYLLDILSMMSDRNGRPAGIKTKKFTNLWSYYRQREHIFILLKWTTWIEFFWWFQLTAPKWLACTGEPGILMRSYVSWQYLFHMGKDMGSIIRTSLGSCGCILV